MKKQIVKSGIDRLAAVLPDITGARIGLITNPTGIDKSFR